MVCFVMATNKKQERHLCFRCGRKRSITQLNMCECGKTYWCKKGCEITGKRQWDKWNFGQHGRSPKVIV